MELIDTHCHLDLMIKNHAADVDAVLQHARVQHLQTLIIPGIEKDQWPQIAQLCEAFDLYFAVGLHPWWIDRQTDTSVLETLAADLMAWTSHPHCVAVGECGLDKMIGTSLKLQQHLVQIHIEVANQCRKPVIFHSRKTDHLLLQVLKKTPLENAGVVHAFTGHPEQAQAFIQHGLYLGIGGTITYPRARKTRSSACSIPLSRLVLETDAPDMPLCGFQGQTNTPAQIYQVAACLAELRDEPLEKICQTTTENAVQLFQLPRR